MQGNPLEHMGITLYELLSVVYDHREAVSAGKCLFCQWDTPVGLGCACRILTSATFSAKLFSFYTGAQGESPMP